eukprot:3021304-Pyramimonas_sp.AAC.1
MLPLMMATMTMTTTTTTATTTTTTTTTTMTTTTTPAGQHLAFFHASMCQRTRWRIAPAALLSEGGPKLI